MDPLLILLLGMLVVVVGVLRLRLHAFLALLAGALVVAALTPTDGIFYREIRDHGAQVLQIDDMAIATLHNHGAVSLPSRLAWVRMDSTSQQVRMLGEITAVDAHGSVRLEAVEGAEKLVLPQAGDWLIQPRDIAAAESLATSAWTSRIATGFGNTCAKIGIVIAMAAIIGRCLLDSGAAERIVAAMRAGLGERNTPVAFALSGFTIGIPVYFDTVFYLLLPLARAMARRTGRDYLLFILSIIIGASMAHSLVPPTPGPLLVAAELNVSLGMMILAGGVVGIIAVTSGFVFAVWANRRWPLSLPEESGEELSDDDNIVRPQPPIVLAFLPIVLPVLLLSVGTLLQIEWNGSGEVETPPATDWLVNIRSAWTILGDKHMALGLATVIALLMLVRYHRPSMNPMRSIQDAIASAGSIVLITAAGGAFGHVLRQSGIADAIQQRFPVGQSGIGLLAVAFCITAVIRIAQGSATVAMITAVGIIAPLVQSMTLPYHTVYVALAIGCGSKPIPWMNDSGFWVITRMSGMTEVESLRTFSVVLTMMGIVGLAVTIAGAIWLPLV